MALPLDAAVATEKRIAGEAICATESLRAFYDRRHGAAAWFDGERLRPDARDLIAAIEAAADDGLDPDDYHRRAIRSLVADPAAHRNDLDLLLTDAFLLLGSHLLAGRVDPESIEPTWCLEPRSFDLAAALQAGLDNHDVREMLTHLAPGQQGYRRLRIELSRLRSIESRGGWPMLGRRPTREQLSTRLGVPDERLDAAIRDFQRLHGLSEDGKAGPNTLRELNVPVAGRIRQIELNMERWRWVPSTFGERYGIINIPEFRLRVLDGGRRVLSMKIVVGKDFQRTPVFSSRITQVVLSPYWNVPASIATKELWPKAARDRTFLAREHIEVLSGGRLRQTPGPWNSLGAIKFNVPNRFNVYLHDTPARSLFDQSVRTFSHGCIRIEQPVELAAYLLRDDPSWPRERIVASSQSGKECAIDVRDPLPIHILYATAFAGDDDEVHFAPDVYRRDALLDRAMRATVAQRGR